MATWSQLGLQDALSPVMEELMFFHDFTMMILLFIMAFISMILIFTLKNTVLHKTLLSGQFLECIWTMFPVVILVQIALPSLVLLYLMENPDNAFLDVKIVGHQWYWTYELSDNISVDSIMLSEAQALETGNFRNLEVNNRLSLPYNTPIRGLVCSTDVLHSWTVPELGVKADANPGRLNQLMFISYRPGVAYGECSEICGALHSMMPISIEFISPLSWVEYISNWKD